MLMHAGSTCYRSAKLIAYVPCLTLPRRQNTPMIGHTCLITSLPHCVRTRVRQFLEPAGREAYLERSHATASVSATTMAHDLQLEGPTEGFRFQSLLFWMLDRIVNHLLSLLSKCYARANDSALLCEESTLRVLHFSCLFFLHGELLSWSKN